MPAEGALVAGWVTLVIVFLISVPFQAHGLALAIQAQVNRVFWLLDVAATAYVAWWLLAGPLGTTRARRLAVVTTVLALSAIRGVYVVDARRRPRVGRRRRSPTRRGRAR